MMVQCGMCVDKPGKGIARWDNDNTSILCHSINTVRMMKIVK